MTEDRKRFEKLSGIAEASLEPTEYFCVWNASDPRLFAHKVLADAVEAVEREIGVDWEALKGMDWVLGRCKVGSP